MANFTWSIKRELLAKKTNIRALQVASLSAFLRTNGCISYTREGLGFFLITESERIGEYYLTLLERLYGISCTANAAEDRLSGKDKLTLSYNGEKSYDILIDLGIFERENEQSAYDLFTGISPRIIADDDSKLAYIKGAFLGGGSCTLPRMGAKTGYHLEFVFNHAQTATDFALLLEEYQLIAKIIERKDNYVVYIATLAGICDFLSVVGADSALKKLNATAEAREENNNSNRVNNCFVGNMDRTATAAAKQCLAIEFLNTNGYLAQMDEEIRILAKCRLEHKEASFAELAQKLQLSKSGVNHRMRKLMEFYSDIIKARGQ
ncbi:MAG: DNA-binding protein WhiA [Clostridia bacterium]|nr:DNA-binding protein WhiA [Clostridia bacterium]